jgi:Zn finger protein HypA/HybF involved in hydrogenase expression
MFIEVIALILTIVLIVTFLRMATRLSDIRETLNQMLELEKSQPENQYTVTCRKCSKPFQRFKLNTDAVKCPHCKEIN